MYKRQFINGTLNLTGPSGLTVGEGGLLGSLVTVGNDQTLDVDNTTTIQSGSNITAVGDFSSDLLQIDSCGQFDAPFSYTNNDEIQMTGSESWIMGSTLTNNGFISGQGHINASLTNNGHVNLSNGTLRFGSQVTNNTSGFISGEGTSVIRFEGGLDNSGSLILTFSTSTVFGNIVNNPTGLVSLAGNSTASFIGDVSNNGQLYVGSGSHAVFGGHTSGSGSFPGSGTVEFVDGFSPGSSPAEVSFGGDVVLGPSSATLMELSGTEPGEYDRLLVAGVLDVAGGLEIELLDDFIPTLDDAFQIFEVTDLLGTFSSVLLPELSGNLSWDHSHLYTSGTLSVIPEPASALLTGISLIGLLRLRRQRR